MRYIDLGCWSIDVGGYRHNDESFYETFIYQMSINRARTTKTQGAHVSLMRILSFLLSLSLGEKP